MKQATGERIGCALCGKTEDSMYRSTERGLTGQVFCSRLCVGMAEHPGMTQDMLSFCDGCANYVPETDMCHTCDTCKHCASANFIDNECVACGTHDEQDEE